MVQQLPANSAQQQIRRANPSNVQFQNNQQMSSRSNPNVAGTAQTKTSSANINKKPFDFKVYMKSFGNFFKDFKNTGSFLKNLPVWFKKQEQTTILAVVGIILGIILVLVGIILLIL
ncbi:hypothetical protein HN587_05355 [Candidatus Woesearchaeota archaeon]|jgi:hypothetical protein|nr:hypothetical protein [Candidatus Woesearchaeota archaeon]